MLCKILALPAEGLCLSKLSVCLHPLGKIQRLSARCGRRRIVLVKLLSVEKPLSCKVRLPSPSLCRHNNRVQSYDLAPSRKLRWVSFSNHFVADYIFKDGSSSISHLFCDVTLALFPGMVFVPLLLLLDLGELVIASIHRNGQERCVVTSGTGSEKAMRLQPDLLGVLTPQTPLIPIRTCPGCEKPSHVGWFSPWC